MPIYDSVHPLGQDLEKVFQAFNADRVTTARLLPSHMRADYIDPFDGSGIARVRIANWETENRATYLFPLEVDDTDMNWKTTLGSGVLAVTQRIRVEDILMRLMSVEVLGREVVSPDVPVDLFQWGVAGRFDDDGRETTEYGGFEGPEYDGVTTLARRHASLPAMILAADIC